MVKATKQWLSECFLRWGEGYKSVDKGVRVKFGLTPFVLLSSSTCFTLSSTDDTINHSSLMAAENGSIWLWLTTPVPSPSGSCRETTTVAKFAPVIRTPLIYAFESFKLYIFVDVYQVMIAIHAVVSPPFSQLHSWTGSIFVLCWKTLIVQRKQILQCVVFFFLLHFFFWPYATLNPTQMSMC